MELIKMKSSASSACTAMADTNYTEKKYMTSNHRIAAGLPIGVPSEPSLFVSADIALPHLVIDINHQRKGHSGGPMHESQWASARHRVGHRDVDQKGSQNRLEKERVIHKRIRHSLLKQRSDASFTNHQICPLHDDNRDEICCIRSRQRLVPRSRLHREQGSLSVLIGIAIIVGVTRFIFPCPRFEVIIIVIAKRRHCIVQSA